MAGIACALAGIRGFGCDPGRTLNRKSAQNGGGGSLGAAAAAELVVAGGRIGPRHLLQRIVALAQGCFELGFEAVGRGAQGQDVRTMTVYEKE